MRKQLAAWFAAFVTLWALTAAAPAQAQFGFTPQAVQLFAKQQTGAPAAAAFSPNAVLLTQEFSPKWAAGFTASPRFVESFWFRCNALGTTTFNFPDKAQGCFNGVFAGNWPVSNTGVDAEHQPGLEVVFESPAAGGNLRVNIGNATGGDNNSALAQWGGASNALATGWHHFIAYGDMTCTSATNVRCGGAYVDGVQVMAGYTDQGASGWTSGDKNIGLSTNPFYLNVFGGGTGPQDSNRIEIAQFFLDTPSSSPTQANSNAPSFAIAGFITAGGGPVDLGPKCASPLGHEPSGACLTNGAATFLTNNLTSGTNPTAAQEFSNAITKVAYAASYAPGETPDRPFAKWAYSAPVNAVCLEASATCASVTNAGNRILQGDLMCLVLIGTLSGNHGNHDEAFAVAGWTQVGTSLNASFITRAIFCKTAGAGDATAAGALITSPTFTWTANPTADTWSSLTATLIDVGKYGPGGTTPTVSAQATSTLGSGSMVCPNITAPAGKSLWMCIHTTFDWSFAGAVGPAATSSLVGKAPTTLAGNRPEIEVEKIDVGGTVSRTAQGTGSGTMPTTTLIFSGLLFLPRAARRRRPIAANDNQPTALRRAA